MNKIVICGVLWDRNLGDMMLMKSATQLFKDAYEGEPIVFGHADFYGRTEFASHNTKKANKVFWESKDWTIKDKIIQYNLALLYRLIIPFSGPIAARVKYLRWKLDPNGYNRVYDYFEDKIMGANLVVFAGGGIIECSMQHDYHLQISLIVNIAKKYSVPVVFNAVGIVKEFKNNDWRYIMMQNALNSSIVKKITVRDDINTMNNHYLKNDNKASLVADSAVWTAEIHGIERKKDSNVIGLGLIRWNAFESYGIDFSKEQLIELYIDLIKEIENQGYDWKLFSNGLESDQKLGEEILQVAGRGTEFIVERPKTPSELILTIGSFKGIIACRLHACITAYSLEVPAVILSWNKKIDQFMDIIGSPERAITRDKFNAKYIMSIFEQTLIEGYDPGQRELYRNSIKNSIREVKGSIKI